MRCWRFTAAASLVRSWLFQSGFKNESAELPVKTKHCIQTQQISLLGAKQPEECALQS